MADAGREASEPSTLGVGEVSGEELRESEEADAAEGEDPADLARRALEALTGEDDASGSAETVEEDGNA